MPSTLNTTFTVTDGNREETVTVTGSKGSGTAGLAVPDGLYTYYKGSEAIALLSLPGSLPIQKH